MRRYIPQFCLFFGCLFSITCFAQKKAKSERDNAVIQDSVVYYEVEIGVNQKNYIEWLAGSWSVDTMRRQARAVPEVLSNVALSFTTDSTYSGNIGCSTVSGTYKLKGTGIKFLTFHSTKEACTQQDQQAAFQRLLTQTVSAYTIDGDVLLLRDGSSNVVFRAHRKKD